MANFWEKKFKKINKSVYDLSKELNIPEEKVKEIIKGEREVPNKEVDRVNQSFSTNKQKMASIERTLMEKYFKDNSISYLKEKFNYKNNKELCDAIGVSNSVLCKIGNKAVKELSDTTLQKVYDFFQDGFNMKAKKNKTNMKVARKYAYYIPKQRLSKEILDWYENTDLRELYKKKGYTIKELNLKLGFVDGYKTIITNFINKHINDRVTSNYIGLLQLYNYFNGLELVNPYAKTENELYRNINTPTFEYETNDNIELLDIEPIENSTCESDTSQDSINTLDNIETLEESENNGVLEQESTPIEKELDKCENEIAMFVTIDEYKKLKKELKRYQWLIDKLMDKYEN